MSALVLCAAFAQAPAKIDIRPESGIIGQDIFQIDIRNLQSDAPYRIDVEYGGLSIYGNAERSDKDGQISFALSSTTGDAPGQYWLRLRQADAQLASAPFTLRAGDSKLDRLAARMDLRPRKLPAGRTLQIALSGAEAFASLSAQITSAEGLLLDSLQARADADGSASLHYLSPATMPPGDYSVTLFAEGQPLAQENFRLDRGESRPRRAAVQPPSGEQGSRHEVALSGFEPQQPFSLHIIAPDGHEAFRDTGRTGSDGRYALTLASNIDDAPGRYTLEVRASTDGELLAESAIDVLPAAPADRARARIEPYSAPIGSQHQLTVRGLGSGEPVTVSLVTGGETILSSEQVADRAGILQMPLQLAADAPPGEYRIRIGRQAGNEPSLRLQAHAAASSADTQLQQDGQLQSGSAHIDFSGQAGQLSLITVQSRDFNPIITIVDSNGLALASNDDSRGQIAARIGPFALPRNGTYRLEISGKALTMPQGAVDGAFTARIEQVAAQPIHDSETQAFQLSSASPSQHYRLQAAAGERLTFSVTGDEQLDSQLAFIAPDGSEYAFDDDGGAGLNPELRRVVIERAGDYILSLTAYQPPASGSGQLEILREPARSLGAEPVPVQLDDKQERDLLTFAAQAGESLLLHLHKHSGNVEDLYVRATVAGMEVMAYSTMGLPRQLSLAFVMPMSGQVALELEKFGYDDGVALELALSRVD